MHCFPNHFLNTCKPSCCCQPCCCPLPPEPESAVFGAGYFFDEDQPNLYRVITPGSLAPTPDSEGVPVADVIIPLNVFNPLLGMARDGSSLVTEKDGLYELRFYIGVQFVSTAPCEVFISKTVNGVTELISETAKTVFGDTSPIGAIEERIVRDKTSPVGATLERVPVLPSLVPQLVEDTAEVCLYADTQLSLVVRVQSVGILRVIPGALLTAEFLKICEKIG